MKEKIYTIPVNDAFNAPCECPLCELEAKTTDDLLHYFLGASLMEPDIRILTNQKGFCKTHLTALYNMQTNRLGLGLMLHTHMKEVAADLDKRWAAAVPAKNEGFAARLKKNYKDDLKKMAGEVEKRVASCALCSRLEYTMDRYMDVIFWQYFEEPEFREKFGKTDGFCLPHLAMLLRGAAKYLTQKEAAVFTADLAAIQTRSMAELEGDLLWFTQKFDYKNQKEPWGNSHDAVPRSIRKRIGKSGLNQ